MSKRINYAGFVGKIIENYEVISYEGKDEKGKHFYKVKFKDTGNEYLDHFTRVRAGKVIDLKRRKLEKSKQVTEKLKQRTRLTKSIKTQKKEIDLSKRNVMALDLASYNCGIVVAESGSIISTGLISSNHSDFRQRGHEITKRILKGIEHYKIDTIILEDIYLGLNSNILALLAELRGMLSYHFLERKIEIVLVTAKAWKSKFDMPKGRKEQKAYSMKLFREYTGREARSDDEADAFLILKYMLTK